MIAIDSHLERQAAFEPEAIRLMSQAFHDACNAMGIFAGDEHGRQVVATRIIDLASAGELDPHVLCERVLREARAAA